jgi:hypothetical protein
MARPSNLQDIFSHGTTPPQNQTQQQSYANPPHGPPTNQIDTLFHGLSSDNNPPQPPPAPGAGNPFRTTEPPGQNVPSTDGAYSAGSAQNTTAPDRDRQQALLSLLGRAAAPPGPQQIPTPPESSQRSGHSNIDSNNEAQGKMLLESLMSGRVIY